MHLQLELVVAPHWMPCSGGKTRSAKSISIRGYEAPTNERLIVVWSTHLYSASKPDNGLASCLGSSAGSKPNMGSSRRHGSTTCSPISFCASSQLTSQLLGTVENSGKPWNAWYRQRTVLW